MKKIRLTQNRFALVDDKDFEWLNQWKWCCSSGYAVRRVGDKHVKMHRIIVGLKPGNVLQTDHIDGNRLNNKRHNLRVCTHTQNNHNRQKIRGSSCYKGVHWCNRSKKWVSRIRICKKLKLLGYFESETEAAKTYDRVAIKYFGAYAFLNYPRSNIRIKDTNAPMVEAITK